MKLLPVCHSATFQKIILAFPLRSDWPEINICKKATKFFLYSLFKLGRGSRLGHFFQTFKLQYKLENSVSNFSHDKFRIDEAGKKYRACKWCAAEISMKSNGRKLFCNPKHMGDWHAENNRRLIRYAKEMANGEN